MYFTSFNSIYMKNTIDNRPNKGSRDSFNESKTMKALRKVLKKSYWKETAESLTLTTYRKA